MISFLLDGSDKDRLAHGCEPNGKEQPQRDGRHCTAPMTFSFFSERIRADATTMPSARLGLSRGRKCANHRVGR